MNLNYPRYLESGGSRAVLAAFAGFVVLAGLLCWQFLSGPSESRIQSLLSANCLAVMVEGLRVNEALTQRLVEAARVKEMIDKVSIDPPTQFVNLFGNPDLDSPARAAIQAAKLNPDAPDAAVEKIELVLESGGSDFMSRCRAGLRPMIEACRSYLDSPSDLSVCMQGQKTAASSDGGRRIQQLLTEASGASEFDIKLKVIFPNQVN